MWADNEADIDLLGFDYLVDELEIVLTESRLLPVTVGVAGEWGSGKSSLMRLAARRLEGDEHDRGYVCVEFSPWRHEEGADVKAALMATVMDALDARLRREEAETGVLERVGRLRRWAHGWALPKALVTGGAMVAGLDPELATMAGDVAQHATAPNETDESHSVMPRSFESVARFHAEFAELMDALEDEIGALVVFVDDLDRCLPAAIVSTFEAIRLFLLAPRTAYVVGAHQRIIQAALDQRYPAASNADSALGVDYLEKVLQLTIAIPPLSGPETLTYANLLFAELYAGREDFEALLAEARRLRAADQLAEAMNEGVAAGILSAVPAQLSEAFELVHRIGPTLARGTRGNPRQIKRFLNTLLLRTRTAAKRGAPIKPGVLAKLMLLEERHIGEFEQLYQWQLAAAGAPIELTAAEAGARSTKAPRLDVEQRTAVEGWVARPGVAAWLELDPPLAGVALGPYFSLARDKLSTATPARRLSARLQELVVALQAPIDRDRDAAVARVSGLTPEDRALLADALFGVAAREPGSNAMSAAAALAVSIGELADAFFVMLTDLPASRVPLTLPPALALRFKGDARLAVLLDTWAAGPKRLAAAVDLVKGA
jgi:hypothetical protein